MTVDTQKSSFWAKVTAYCYGRIAHVIWAGELQTFSEIEDIWLAGQNLTDRAGNLWMISKLGIDRRGYNDEGVRRTDEVDAFVEYMVSKYAQGDEVRVYAFEGHPVLVGDRPFQIVSTKDVSNNRRKVDIKIVKMSNLYLKNSLHRAIQRGIEAVDGADHHANLFFINEGIIAQDKAGTNGLSYTQQMTSEVFDYGRDPKTKNLNKTKSWIRLRKNNHWWDCAVMAEAFAEIDKVALATKPIIADYASILSEIAIDIHR